MVRSVERACSGTSRRSFGEIWVPIGYVRVAAAASPRPAPDESSDRRVPAYRSDEAAKISCDGGEIRYATSTESGSLRLDAASFRLVEEEPDAPSSAAARLQTPRRHAAGFREWVFAALRQDAAVAFQRGKKKWARRRAVGVAVDADRHTMLVVFKTDGRRSSVREFALPPGISCVVDDVPPSPGIDRAADFEGAGTLSGLHADAAPAAQPAGWFARGGRVRVR